MKVISIKEPFATLIKNGIKKIETRSWKTNYRGELFIHASKKNKEFFLNNVIIDLIKDMDMNYGNIICKCKLVDCIYIDEEFIENIKKNNFIEFNIGEYKLGRYAWILEDIEPIYPIPAKGQLNIWNFWGDYQLNDNNKDYYKAYEKRYAKVYENNILWSSKENTFEVLECMEKYNISKKSKILDLGCGEGRDTIYLLENGYDVLGIDYSQTVIDKCKELSSYEYNDHFRQFDLLSDKMNQKFDFIYSVAVLHMFVLDEHRYKFLDFIREHLTNDGLCFISLLGDGKKKYASNIEEAFVDVKRKVLNNNKELEVATTSCRIVDWEHLEKEIKDNNLIIKKKWISNKIPEFKESMCVLIKKGDLDERSNI